MKLNIPLILTTARIILVPFLMLALMRQQFMLALSLLIIAALTDLFDGFLARLLRQETALGAALDPVADKLLVVGCYGALMLTESAYFRIPVWFITLVVIRELLILLGAGYWGLQRHVVPIKPTMLGKITMALQLMFMGFLVVSLLVERSFPIIFTCLLITVACCVVGSFMQYGYQLYRNM